jgi:glycosyltransferase involved in cell wall biosynthesis
MASITSALDAILSPLNNPPQWERDDTQEEPVMANIRDPLVSVVIPTYNRAHVIERTIADVRKQTYPNLQIVIVDDGSADDTQARLMLYGNRITVVRQENGGAASARNRGIRESRGEIIAFQDSDDEWHPTKIARQVELLQKLGPSVPCCFCNAVFRSETGPETLTFNIGMLRTPHEEGLWLNPAEILATRCLFFNQVVAVRRNALEKVGGFNSRLRYLEEWDLALKLSLLGPWAFIREPLTYWNPGSSESITRRAEREAAQLYACGVHLLADTLKMASDVVDANIRTYLMRTLSSHRRMLYASRVREMNFPGASLVGSVLLHAERFWGGMMRRTQGFPEMVTQALN